MHSKPRNFHVDIETAGLAPGKSIIEIGICCEETLKVLNIQRVWDNTVIADRQTLEFHGDARIQEWKDTPHALAEDQLIPRMHEYFADLDLLEGDIIWMRRPAFDQAHLEHLARIHKQKLPWEYYQVWDHFTYVATLAGLRKDYPDWDEKIGPIEHTALADAQRQMVIRQYYAATGKRV